MKLLLIGPMGAGKSTVGKILSETLGWPYLDNDTGLVANYGYSKEEIEKLDIETLHTLESQYFLALVDRKGPLIAGAAASVIDKEINRALMENFFTIYLRLPLAKIIERAGSKGVGRQAVILGGTEILIERFNRRDPLYKLTAKLIIELSDKPEVDAKKILEAIRD